MMWRRGSSLSKTTIHIPRSVHINTEDCLDLQVQVDQSTGRSPSRSILVYRVPSGFRGYRETVTVGYA